jgi:hypothetical protein
MSEERRNFYENKQGFEKRLRAGIRGYAGGNERGDRHFL